jgi:hypothetical protein
MGDERSILEKITAKIQGLRRLRGRKEESSGSMGIDPASIVWIFGGPRTGSTWLGSMMEELEGQTVWREPLVGELFGYLYYMRAWAGHYKSKHFILGSHRETWLASIRSFVLEGANARFPEVADGGYLIVKEPNGSLGAPLLMEALPETRMILLVRDPRDVVASALEAGREGSWFHSRRTEGTNGADPNTHPFFRGLDGIVEHYVKSVNNAKTAYDAHEGRKVLIRYEDLRADTLGEMRRIYSTLRIDVDRMQLSGAVEKHAWEGIPEEEKGEGKFRRKASPGSWREDLTEEQIAVVEDMARPLLEEFYPDRY